MRLIAADGHRVSGANLLRPIRCHAHRFGGSHAQRDLLDPTPIDAAQCAGDAG